MTKSAMPTRTATTPEKASAGKTPTRSPSSPITAACTAPARPAATARATAIPVTRMKLYAHDSTTRGKRMVRAIVLYDQEPDAGRYEQHAELCRNVPGATFRHGRIF